MVKVTEDCIGCATCVHLTSEELFELDPETWKARVKKQPTTEAELNLYKDAKDACPVQAIQD